jgi:winged helix DNA-binding protein
LPELRAVTWPQVLAWRMRRQYLDPVGTASVEDVVRRLGAVAAQDPANAELAIRARRQQSKPGEVGAALADGRIIKVWVMRGAKHLVTPEDGGAYLALRAAKRQWELPSWQSYYGLTPADWGPFREAIREALGDVPMTPQELGTAITVYPKFRHLAFVFTGRWDSLIKALMWQGVMSFGPSRDGSLTFQRLDHNPRWAGVPDTAEAGRLVVESYLRAYGPASVENIRYWQNAGERNVRSWLASLGDRLTEVEVEGERRYVLREDLDQLVAMRPTKTVRLLPGFDQWTLGPGTADGHVLPAGRRHLFSRQAHMVVVGGVVSGTWTLGEDQVAIDWFPEAGRIPRRALAAEVERLAVILDRPLELTIATG